MSEWEWNGARWWKFDFHSHTPASTDYGKGHNQHTLRQRTPREWLLDYMRAGIDCVAVTDHNCGTWIDQLKEQSQELQSEKPDGYRPLCIFPGVEISVNGGIHLLAVFEPNTTRSDIDSLLGAVGYQGTKGSSDDVTGKSFQDVVAEISKQNGIAIPARVDRANGLYLLEGTTLQQALTCNGIFAMEVVDPSEKPPNQFHQNGICWTQVLGSDAHHPEGQEGQAYPGSQFTWVKMGTPSFEGLRLALLDGSLSVRPSNVESGDPNQHAPLVLESIEVCKARYMGRPKPFKVKLNPWLNTIIGGRGTGKSTLIEFLRLALRRQQELPPELEDDFKKYAEAYQTRKDAGLLTSNTLIKVVYRKNGARYRIQWDYEGIGRPIEEEADGTWRAAEGDVQQRFPVQMYSQKQVFQLASRPLSLLNVIDAAAEIDYAAWETRWREEEGRFLFLRARAREIEASFSEEPRLRGELEDVKRKLSVFEQAGHADILKTFQRRRRQEEMIKAWEGDWSGAAERLRQIAHDIVPDPPDQTLLDVNSSEDQGLLTAAAGATASLEAIKKKLLALADEAEQVLAKWRKRKNDSSWMSAVRSAHQSYEGLQEKLAQEEVEDPKIYGALVQRRQAVEGRLKKLENRRTAAVRLREDADQSLRKLQEMRRELTERRRRFLQRVLSDNQYVRIAVVPYGAKETVEAEFRELLQRQESGFEKDIGSPGNGGLLGSLYEKGASSEAIETNLADIKKKVRAIAQGDYDGGELGDRRFAGYLSRLKPEVLDRMDVWFPQDSLKIEYCSTGKAAHFTPIAQGSPGQKTAALLAFLLSYGSEPLILDQPEDDLDNTLIYDLIVKQLRDIKQHRQVLVVTHNANIVVNGDAELVIALEATEGRTNQLCDGSLQEKAVRNTICTLMEGGREAFEQRYRRIALEGGNV